MEYYTHRGLVSVLIGIIIITSWLPGMEDNRFVDSLRRRWVADVFAHMDGETSEEPIQEIFKALSLYSLGGLFRERVMVAPWRVLKLLNGHTFKHQLLCPP